MPMGEGVVDARLSKNKEPRFKLRQYAAFLIAPALPFLLFCFVLENPF